MLVAPSPHIEDGVVAPAKTFAEAFRDGGTQYPVFRVGFHCSPGHRRTLDAGDAVGLRLLERLLLEQGGDERVELVPMRAQEPERPRVALVDEAAHLRVEELARLAR